MRNPKHLDAQQLRLRSLFRIIAALTIATMVVIGIASERADATPVGLVLSRHGVVKSSTLPSCSVEDGSSGPLPCSWNFPHHHDGNGQGLAYYVGTHGNVHYVWPVNPVTSTVGPPVHWVTSALNDVIAETDRPLPHNWRHFITWRHGGHRYVASPNGHHRRVY